MPKPKIDKKSHREPTVSLERKRFTSLPGLAYDKCNDMVNLPWIEKSKGVVEEEPKEEYNIYYKKWYYKKMSSLLKTKCDMLEKRCAVLENHLHVLTKETDEDEETDDDE